MSYEIAVASYNCVSPVFSKKQRKKKTNGRAARYEEKLRQDALRGQQAQDELKRTRD